MIRNRTPPAEGSTDSGEHDSGEHADIQAASLLQDAVEGHVDETNIAVLVGALLQESSLLVGIAEIEGRTFRHEASNAAARSFFRTSEGAAHSFTIELDSLAAQQFALSHRISTLTKQPISFEYRHLEADEACWLDINLSILPPRTAGVPRFLYVGCPIAAPSHAADRSHVDDSIFAGLVETAYNGIVVHDKTVIAYDEKMAELFGYDENELIGKSVLLLIDADRRRTVLEHFQSESSKPFEAIGRRKDGSTFFLEAVSHPYKYKDRDVLVTGVRDITDRIRMEEYLLHSVTHDDLTGIANRSMFLNRLWSAMTKRPGEALQPSAVLFMDLDGFKEINDTHGHLVGDEVLMEVAQRLDQSVRNNDLAARLGGDEFGVILHDVTDPEEIKEMARRVRNALHKPYVIRGNTYSVNLSIGIALCDDALRQPDSLLRDADSAMYAAKRRRNGEPVVFHPVMRGRERAPEALEPELRRALEQKEFKLCYQPIVALENGRIAGVEALVRWEHPDRGLLLPDEFIPASEELGLVAEIDRAVLAEASAQFLRWIEMDENGPGFLSVNISPVQLQTGDISAHVAQVLHETKCPPDRLVLEITERVFVTPVDFRADLTRLASMKVRVCIDDFATGYSSLNLLSRMSFDLLKLDKSFIRRIEGSNKKVEMLKTIVGLAHDLDMEVVAEGIETERQLGLVREIGCEYGQGFFFAKPQPADEMERFFVNNRIGSKIGLNDGPDDIRDEPNRTVTIPARAQR